MPKEKKLLPNVSTYHFKKIFWPTVFPPFELPMYLSSPIIRQKGDPALGKPLTFLDLATLLGLSTNNGTAGDTLERFRKRFGTYRFWYKILAWAASLFFTLPSLYLLAYFAVNVLGVLDTVAGGLAFLFLGDLVIYILIAINQRIISVILDRIYADTLSCISCLFLLVNLAKQDALVDLKNRRQLLTRIRALRRYLILLPYQVGITDSFSYDTVNKKFRLLTQFAEDKECQMIIPSANSQVELFTELRAFLEILLSANYGDFNYQSSIDAETVPPQSKTSSFFGGFLKLLGTVAPVLLLIAMFLFPEQLGSLGIENNVISYVILAWLLLAIDANLKLGIVERLSSLAKALRDLK